MIRIGSLLAVLLVACPTDPEPEDGGPDAPGTDAPVPCTVDVEPEAPLADPPEHTPAWAFEPWISKDISDRAEEQARKNRQNKPGNRRAG